MATSNSGQRAGSGTLLLILIQVASRGFTFVGNQFLLRYLLPSLLGIAVQLELVSVTSLYFARESLRVALQRQPPASGSEKESEQDGKAGSTRGQDAQTVVNLSYLSVLLGFGVSALFGSLYLHNAPDEILQSPNFRNYFLAYGCATLLELLAEPAFVVIQQKGLYKDRARAETYAAMVRCLTACLVAVISHRRGNAPSILPFAAGQVGYALTLLQGYVQPTMQTSRAENFSLWPVQFSTASALSGYYLGLFHKQILSLAATMYMQSIFKLLLTQGDALIMSVLSSLADQGAFALASNYGGLLARLVFQPVEESSRSTFGRLLAPTAAMADNEGEKSPATSTRAKSIIRAKSASTTSPTFTTTNIQAALTHLSTTLKSYLVLSLPLISLAPSLLPLLTPLVLSPQWRTPSTISLLQLYCYYIPLTALNGILDAFVTSVATPTQLRSQSLWMLVFTGVYGGVAWLLMDRFALGSLGLLGANMANMALRIVWGAEFLKRWVAEREDEIGEKEKSKNGIWRGFVVQTLPGAVAVGAAVAVLASLAFAPSTVVDGRTGKIAIQSLVMWTASAAFLASAMLYSEGRFLLGLLESILPRRLAARIPASRKRQPTPNPNAKQRSNKNRS